MVNFRINIAFITVEITALFETTLNFCKNFICQNTPDFSVEISMDDIDYERKRSYEADIREGRSHINFSNEYLETLAVYRKIVEVLPQYNAFLFHGSAVAVDGVAYLFTAKSGTGKSTHVSFYREKFGERAVMVNDDKPLILIKDNKAFVCGTPWCGKHNLGNNIISPLKAICVLKRGSKNVISKVKFGNVFDIIIGQAYRPQNPKNLLSFVELVSKLSILTNFYELSCNLDPDSALVSYSGMNK
jgi:hypothetical protein